MEECGKKQVRSKNQEEEVGAGLGEVEDELSEIGVGPGEPIAGVFVGVVDAGRLRA